MANFAEVLRMRRTEIGLSQAGLARALGVGQQTVSRWESGAGVPSARRIPAMAEVLSVDAAYLHRLVGNLSGPGAQPTPFDELYAHVGELADRELELLVEASWRELRRRYARAVVARDHAPART